MEFSILPVYSLSTQLTLCIIFPLQSFHSFRSPVRTILQDILTLKKNGEKI
jgi:hypothetical protein